MTDPARCKIDAKTMKPTLNYASPRTPRPDAAARLVIGLLIAFLALAAGFFAIVIYMSCVR